MHKKGKKKEMGTSSGPTRTLWCILPYLLQENKNLLKAFSTWTALLKCIKRFFQHVTIKKKKILCGLTNQTQIVINSCLHSLIALPW